LLNGVLPLRFRQPPSTLRRPLGGSNRLPEKEYFPRLIGFPRALEAGFDLYDTQEKTRLILRLPTRADAEYECTNRNNPPDTNATDAAGSV